MGKTGEKQYFILKRMKENGGTITKKEAAEMAETWYYCNQAKHVGDVLSRMVNAGTIVRLKKGLYKINESGRKPGRDETPENQIKLF